MRVLITGSNGFIGSAISRNLSRDHDVFGLTRPYNAKHPFNCCKSERLHDLVSLDDQQLDESVSGMDAIIHCAATISWDSRRLDEVVQNNALVTERLARAAIRNRVRRFIFISAGARFGFSGSKIDLVTEGKEFVPSSSDPYAFSKWKAEELLNKLGGDLDITILYPSTVYGAGDVKLNSGTLVRLIKKRSIAIGFPGGTSFVAIGDLAEAVRLALGQSFAHGVRRYIISAENMTYLELFQKLQRALHGRVSKWRIPVPALLRPCIMLGVNAGRVAGIDKKIAFFNRNIIGGFFRFRYFSNSSARSQLGWEPKVSFEESVKEAEQFYSDQGLV